MPINPNLGHILNEPHVSETLKYLVWLSTERKYLIEARDYLKTNPDNWIKGFESNARGFVDSWMKRTKVSALSALIKTSHNSIKYPPENFGAWFYLNKAAQYRTNNPTMDIIIYNDLPTTIFNDVIKCFDYAIIEINDRIYSVQLVLDRIKELRERRERKSNQG